MEFFLFLLYIITLVLVIIYNILNIKKKKLCIENFFFFFIILNYLFIPTNILIFGSKFYLYNLKGYLYPPLKYVSLSSLLATIIFIFSYILGTKITFSQLKLPSILRIYNLKIQRVSISKIFCYVLTILSTICLLMYIKSNGGLFSAIINAGAIRAGVVDELDLSSQALYFRIFIEFSIIPVSIYTWQKMSTQTERLFLVFIPLFTLSFYYLFLFLGKGSILLLVLLLYFSICLKNQKYYVGLISVVLLGMFLSLGILDELFIVIGRLAREKEGLGFGEVLRSLISVILSGNLGKGEYEDFLRESNNQYLQALSYFAYLQVSLNLSLQTSYDLQFLQDFVIAIKLLIPDALIGLDSQSSGIDIVQLNTAIYNHTYPKIPPPNEAFIPPGIITSAIYSLSFPGLILWGGFWGSLHHHVDLFFKKLLTINTDFSGWYALSIIILGFYSQAGVPRFIIGKPVFICFFLLFWVSFKLRFFK